MAFSFLPKEDEYFTLFSQMSAKIQEAAAILVEMLQGSDAEFDSLSKTDQARRARMRRARRIRHDQAQ